jgi:hypothetical protein
MDIEKVLKDISSGDNHLAWSAGWSIIKANVAELNVIPLDSIAAIRAAVAKLPNLEHSSVVDSREIPKLALKILEFKNSILLKDFCQKKSRIVAIYKSKRKMTSHGSLSFTVNAYTAVKNTSFTKAIAITTLGQNGLQSPN